MPNAIRLLIVEDSVTQREIFKRLFHEDGRFVVIAEAATGEEAVALVATHSPDVVLMDIHMPDMDGITATREIMRRFPAPIVVASSSLRKHEIDLAMTAFEAGAVSVIEKPQGAVLLHLHRIAPRLRDELIAATKAKLRPLREAPRQTRLVARQATGASAITIVGVCASTGGPPVLLDLLSTIPKPYPLPILLVQHISPGFEAGFARWLSETSSQNVQLAVDGQRLAPGVWLSPAGHHLQLASGNRIVLPEGSVDELHCPSGNPLFASLARHGGPSAAGILLTGMGEDGADGLLELHRAGGTTVVQDEASSLIWGMPKAGKNRGAAKLELNPAAIAAMLARFAAAPGNATPQR